MTPDLPSESLLLASPMAESGETVAMETGVSGRSCLTGCTDAVGLDVVDAVSDEDRGASLFCCCWERWRAMFV